MSTAFVHADLTSEEPIFVWPPIEFYPERKIRGRLRKAMYGLRTAPRDWQLHLFENNGKRWRGYRRLQSDPNVYVHARRLHFILAYVDELLILAPKEIMNQAFEELAKHFLIRKAGHLNEEGSQTDF